MHISNSKVLAREHTYILLSRVSHLEPTFPIAPKQSPLSSTISVIQIGPISGAELMNVMLAVYDDSKHLGMKAVGFVDGVTDVDFSVDEEDERWRRICIDGDIVTLEKGGTIEAQVCEGISLENGLTLIISCYI